MNSKVHPLIVALVMVLTFVALALWMWGRGEASIIGGPAELRLDPNGHLYIQVQNRLIEHDANGEYVRTHELENLGVEQFLGTYAFFSNGDVLLRRGPDPRSFSDDIRAFQRRTNESSIKPLTPESGLFRCKLDTTECVRFGKAGIDFKATHGITIDWPSDDVYISDTTRHLLRKYSADGMPLSDPITGFKFPNQVLIEGERLYVADTNNHRIRVFDPASDSFGTALANHSVTPPAANREERRWPSHFARVGDEWWVNIMRTGMNEGGLYIFDDNWQFMRQAILPPDADPISLIAFGDEVLVTDWNNDTVHRLSVNGELLGSFESPGLTRVFDDSESARANFEIVSYSGVFLLALVIGGLMVRALVVTVSPASAAMKGNEEPETVAPGSESLRLAPNPKIVTFAKRSVQFAGFLLILVAASIYYVFLSRDVEGVLALDLLLPGGAMIAIFVLSAWVTRTNAATAIELRGNVLTLRDSSGRQSSCAVRDASYDQTVVATRDMAVFLGRPSFALYDRKALDEQLFPRLSIAKKLSVWQMQMLLIKLRHPQGLSAIFAAAGLAAYAAWSFAETGL